LIATFLELDYSVISESLAELPDLMRYIVEDYERYDTNSIMLLTLNRLLKAITW